MSSFQPAGTAASGGQNAPRNQPAGEDRIDEPHGAEEGAVEPPGVEVRAAEPRAGEVRAAEVRAVKVGTDKLLKGNKRTAGRPARARAAASTC